MKLVRVKKVLALIKFVLPKYYEIKSLRLNANGLLIFGILGVTFFKAKLRAEMLCMNALIYASRSSTAPALRAYTGRFYKSRFYSFAAQKYSIKPQLKNCQLARRYKVLALSKDSKWSF